MSTVLPTFQIALLQMKSIVGDFEGNARKIQQGALKAQQAGASILLTPEMSLVGYPAEDWVLRSDFCQRARDVLIALARDLKASIPVLVGTVWLDEEGHRRNALVLLKDGQISAMYFKHHLPEYGVFDEARLFVPGNDACVVEIDGVKLGLSICEDLWYADVARQAKEAGAQVLLSANASPFEMGKIIQREETVIRHATDAGLPLVYVNLVGGQDELIFDGSSFATNLNGDVVQRQKRFEEDFSVISLESLTQPVVANVATETHRLAELHDALKLAVRDYVHHNGFQQVVLGLSGGIDSALVATLAAQALGAANVLAVMMPTRYTADLSFSLAKKLADNLGIQYIVRPIEALFSAYQEILTEDFAGRSWDVTEENLQARIRGVLLMAYSNKFQRLVLTTGNKSETAVGYSTLYGDTAGAFALLKDVYKTEVWALCRYINQREGREVIPEDLINRPPSAELRTGQLDEDSLPKYEVLDVILRKYVDERRSLSEIAEQVECDVPEIERVIRLVHRNEYKRRQSPMGPKVSGLAFGRDWRYPITAKVAL